MQISSNYPWMLHSGTFVQTEAANTLDFQSPMIYEVIRVIGGKPLFYEAHLARLTESALLLGYDLEMLKMQIHMGTAALIEKNGIQEDNIKLIVANLDSSIPQWLIYGVKGFYPPQTWFEAGVKTTLLKVVRHNPQAKVINQSLAERVDQMRATTDVFEALLVDEQGRITEGSRSNVFFIQGDKLLTPKSELALKGITRLKLLEVLEAKGILCEEADIQAQDLAAYDGIFITGTSIDLLPVASVDDLSFKTAQLPIMQTLLAAYRDLMNTSLANF